MSTTAGIDAVTICGNGAESRGGGEGEVQFKAGSSYAGGGDVVITGRLGGLAEGSCADGGDGDSIPRPSFQLERRDGVDGRYAEARSSCASSLSHPSASTVEAWFDENGESEAAPVIFERDGECSPDSERGV